ncbi:Ras-related protein RABA2a [Orchesella cincta]|uniref:Ras-related protein RABA2a n=1 Tax=Orchesella cincta TaxID=48709 RepID=A0A1D2NG78_ORCCI|nr:Ras-related protein RABA2a [Orchesella cincta]
MNEPVVSSVKPSRVPEQKVILLGDFGVGKTSLFRRFTNDTFTTSTDRKSTLGLDFYTRSFQIPQQSDVVKIQLWDTGGMERVASVTSSYYKFAEAAVLVFDLHNPDTFHSLAQHMIEVASYAENCKVFLCGNKVDLVESVNEEEHASRNSSINSREYETVSIRDMEQFCEQTSVITNMYVTSCKTNQGVSEMFEDISRQIRNASRARYELAKHSVLQDELPFQLTDDEELESQSQTCAC